MSCAEASRPTPTTQPAPLCPVGEGAASNLAGDRVAQLRDERCVDRRRLCVGPNRFQGPLKGLNVGVRKQRGQCHAAKGLRRVAGDLLEGLVPPGQLVVVVEHEHEAGKRLKDGLREVGPTRHGSGVRSIVGGALPLAWDLGTVRRHRGEE